MSNKKKKNSNFLFVCLFLKKWMFEEVRTRHGESRNDGSGK